MLNGQRSSLPLHYCIYSLMKQQTTFLDFTFSNSSLSLTTQDRFKHHMVPQPNMRATCSQRSQFLLVLHNFTGSSKKLCFPSPICSNTDPDLSFIYTADSSMFPRNINRVFVLEWSASHSTSDLTISSKKISHCLFASTASLTPTLTYPSPRPEISTSVITRCK